MALTNPSLDPVGIGVRLPLSFESGRLRLTASTRVAVTADGGIDENSSSMRGGTVATLAATDTERVSVIRQSMRRIVETPRGSRIMAGELGCAVDSQVFEPNDASTHSIIAAVSGLAVAEQEPRIRALRVSANQDEETNKVRVYIDIAVKETGIISSAELLERGA